VEEYAAGTEKFPLSVKAPLAKKWILIRGGSVSLPIDCISDFVFACSTVRSSDVILVPGGSHPQLMQEAARLYQSGLAPLILPSGGANSNLPNHASEWQFLRDIGVSLGVPAEAILRENRASNTFENALFSYEVLKEQGLSIKRAILVCKAFHARRALLSYQYSFPTGVEFLVAPVPDRRGIAKDNWYLDANSARIVMEEVKKIGSYFGDKIDRLLT